MRTTSFGVLVVWIMVGWGCAATGPASRQGPWQCPPGADEAVTRGDWQDALARHRAIVRQTPDNCLALYHLGYIHGKLEDREQEVEDYERALKCGYDGNDQLLFNLGMAYGESGRLAEAVDAFEGAVKLNPGNADNHFGLGLMYHAAGRTDDAINAFAKALSMDAHHREARLALCRILLDQGRLDEVKHHLDLLSREPDEDGEVRQLRRLYRRRRILIYTPPPG